MRRQTRVHIPHRSITSELEPFLRQTLDLAKGMQTAQETIDGVTTTLLMGGCIQSDSNSNIVMDLLTGCSMP